MKEFIVCYTLEDDIKQEKIIKDHSATKEEIIQEILKKIEQRTAFSLKGDKGDYDWINSSFIRYVQVYEKKQS